jgi:hypothetical protein
MSTPTFKVGDRVRLQGDPLDGKHKVGTGTVLGFRKRRYWFVRVRFDSQPMREYEHHAGELHKTE